MRRKYLTNFFMILLCFVACITLVIGYYGQSMMLLSSSSTSSSSSWMKFLSSVSSSTTVNLDFVNSQKILESHVFARARELDEPATRHALTKYTGIGRYSDRTRYWYILARDIILNRPNATLTKYNNHVFTVVFATPWFGNLHKWATGYTECPAPSKKRYPKNNEKGCVISFYPDYMKSLLPYADVVLYHRATYEEEQILPPKIPYKKNQRHTLLAAEHFPSMFDPKVMSLFNSEMSFRQRSIFRDGGYELLGLGLADKWSLTNTFTWNDLFTRKLIPINQRYRMSTLPDRSKATVTWASTHCESHSGRESLVRKLQTFIPIHIFGLNCMANMKSEEIHPWPSQSELFRYYKFHLALENSRCDDYVTEKIFLALGRGQVPIYLGANNIDEYMPGKDSYINIQDFTSVKELADYLQYLDNHDEEYGKYFVWRTRPFSTYGKILQQIIEEVLPLGNNTGPGAPGQPIWYKCSMCYALQYEKILEQEQNENGGIDIETEMESSEKHTKSKGNEELKHRTKTSVSSSSMDQTEEMVSKLATTTMHPLSPVPPFTCEPGIQIIGEDTELFLTPEELQKLTNQDKKDGKIIYPDNKVYPFRWKKRSLNSPPAEEENK